MKSITKSLTLSLPELTQFMTNFGPPVPSRRPTRPRSGIGQPPVSAPKHRMTGHFSRMSSPGTGDRVRISERQRKLKNGYRRGYLSRTPKPWTWQTGVRPPSPRDLGKWIAATWGMGHDPPRARIAGRPRHDHGLARHGSRAAAEHDHGHSSSEARRPPFGQRLSHQGSNPDPRLSHCPPASHPRCTACPPAYPLT